MNLLITVLSFFILSQSLANFVIKEGVYKNKKCFIKISKDKDEMIHIQFAHKDYYFLYDQDSYEPNTEFHPDNVLGTNIFYDTQRNRVVFGPDKCGQGNFTKIKIITSNNSWSIKCGGRFSKELIHLKLHTNRSHYLTKFSFSEKYNENQRMRYSWPWGKKTLYDFSCGDFEPEIMGELSF